jgi:hypothetical protein
MKKFYKWLINLINFIWNVLKALFVYNLLPQYTYKKTLQNNNVMWNKLSKMPLHYAIQQT